MIAVGGRADVETTDGPASAPDPARTGVGSLVVGVPGDGAVPEVGVAVPNPGVAVLVASSPTGGLTVDVTASPGVSSTSGTRVSVGGTPGTGVAVAISAGRVSVGAAIDVEVGAVVPVGAAGVAVSPGGWVGGTVGTAGDVGAGELAAVAPAGRLRTAVGEAAVVVAVPAVAPSVGVVSGVAVAAVVGCPRPAAGTGVFVRVAGSAAMRVPSTVACRTAVCSTCAAVVRRPPPPNAIRLRSGAPATWSGGRRTL